MADQPEMPDAERTFVCPWCESPLWVKECTDGEVWYCEEDDCIGNQLHYEWDMEGHFLRCDIPHDEDIDEDDAEKGFR